MTDNEYSGGMFDSTAAAGRVSGLIHFRPGALVFSTAAGKRVEMSLDRLEIKDGGTSQRTIFFSHPDHAESVYTTDVRILKAPELDSVQSSSEHAGRLRKRFFTRRALFTTLLLVVAASVFGVWALKNVMVSVVVRNIPPEWERKMGEAAIGSVGAEFVQDAEAERLLAKMIAPLLETKPENCPPLEFHIARDPTINAFAAPGGQVVINTGLLAAADRPEQVLGVVAHEIAHVTQRHGVRAVVDSLSIRLLLGLATGGTDMPVEWVDAGSQLLQLKHSRKQESEADDVGWRHLTRAGVDPRGLEEFFRLIQDEHGGLSVELLSTHPAPQSRIDELRQRWQQDAAMIQTTAVDPELLSQLKNRLSLQ